MSPIVSHSRALLLASVLLVLAGGSSALQTGKRQKLPSGPPAPGGSQFDSTPLELQPSRVDFGAVPSGQSQSVKLELKNAGTVEIELRTIRFLLGVSGDSAAFRVVLNGKTYLGGIADTTRSIQPPVTLPAGQTIFATLRFQPTEEQLDAFDLRIECDDNAVVLPVSGLGGHAGDPFLHVTMDGPAWMVDYDMNGEEPLVLDGTGSHTHEPGHSLSAYEWRVDGEVRSTTPTLSTVLTTPSSDVTLQITDDNVPPRSLIGQKEVRVVSPFQVPGVLARYYDASASGSLALLDNVPASADFLEQRPSMNVGAAGHVGGSPFTGNVLVCLSARLWIEIGGEYELV